MQLKLIATIVVAFITLALNYGSRGSFGLFLKPFASEFGTSRGTISFILSINMITYGTLAFFTGYLNDRFGPRAVMLMGGCLAGASFIFCSAANTLGQIILYFGILFGAATCLLSQITALSLLVKLPSGGSSLALGLVGSGPGIGNLFIAPLIGGILAHADWRTAMQTMGWFFLSYLLLPLFFLRQSKNKSVPLRQKLDISVGKVLFKGRSILLLFFSFHLMGIAIYGVLSQEAAYATDLGMSSTEAAWALGLVSGIGVVSSPVVGWVSHRLWNKKMLGGSILAMAVLGIFFIFVARSWPVLALGSIIVGVAYASYIPIFPSIVRNLVGQDLFGRIWGLIAMGGSAGAALGSWAGGYLHDLRGNYDLLWMIMASCFLAASITLFLVDTTSTETVQVL